jgi:hypothetical protein
MQNKIGKMRLAGAEPMTVEELFFRPSMSMRHFFNQKTLNRLSAKI